MPLINKRNILKIIQLFYRTVLRDTISFMSIIRWSYVYNWVHVCCFFFESVIINFDIWLHMRNRLSSNIHTRYVINTTTLKIWLAKVIYTVNCMYRMLHLVVFNSYSKYCVLLLLREATIPCNRASNQWFRSWSSSSTHINFLSVHYVWVAERFLHVCRYPFLHQWLNMWLQ